MADDRVRFTLRLPRELHSRLVDAAARLGRSRNAAVTEAVDWWTVMHLNDAVRMEVKVDAQGDEGS